MKIFIFGSTGMLGRYIYSYFTSKSKEIICINRDNINISEVTYELLLNSLIKHDPQSDDIIINCIGIIPQSKNNNDTSKKNYFLINSIFPIMLSSIAFMKKMKFIHITTDCVFSGTKGNYSEIDIHDEINDYGISKSLGELGYNTTIIRTSIIGEEIKNKYSLLEWVKKHNNETINGYNNHYWNGVTCLQLSKIIYNIIENNIWWSGVRHIFSPNIVSKYELVKIINKIYELNNNIIKFNTEKTIDKTLNTIYDTNSIFNIPTLEKQILELKEYGH